MRFSFRTNLLRSLPRRPLAGLLVLAVAGFLAAVGTAQITRQAQTTTTGTTSSTTSSTGSTSPTSSTSTTTTTTSDGCPSGASGASVTVSDLSAPASLEVASFTTSPSTITGGFSKFTATVEITDTCGQPVQGASVYVTAVPYRQVSIEQGTTGPSGTVTLTFSRLSGFPADRHQELMVFFVRAEPGSGDQPGGISARRLVSVPVYL